jgi:hypothetical protein
VVLMPARSVVLLGDNHIYELCILRAIVDQIHSTEQTGRIGGGCGTGAAAINRLSS